MVNQAKFGRTMKEKATQQKPYAGNPHMRFDEGAVMAFCRLLLLAAALAAGCAQAASPTPWAHWLPDPTIPRPTSNSTQCSCTDVTGNGNTLTTLPSLLPMSLSSEYSNKTAEVNAEVRGDVFYATGTGAAVGWFDCPSLRSRAFSIWLKPNTDNHAYGPARSDLTCLLNGFSGMTIYQIYTQSVWHVAFGTRLANEQMSTSMSGLSVFSSASVNVLRGSVWQHLLFSLEDTGATDGSGNMICNLSIYRDGELVASDAGLAVPVQPAGTAYISNTGTWTVSPYKGRVDDIRVWTNALTAAEAKAVYEESRLCRLIGHWPMDQVEVKDGVRVTPDISGNGADMALGALGWITNGVVGSGAFFFEGGPSTDENPNVVYDSYGLATNATGKAYPGDVTVAMWLKRSKDQQVKHGARLFMFCDSGWMTCIEANSAENRAIGDCMLLGTSGSNIPSATGRAEEWAHVVLVFHYDVVTNVSGELDLYGVTLCYRNGELIYTGAPAPTTTTSFFSNMGAKGAKFRLANVYQLTRPFCGAIDDVYWYAGRLTDDEIRALYRGPAKVSAGEDFAVVGETAVLNAEFPATPVNALAAGYAGNPRWTLVRAPSGGESAAIENPMCATTAVSLPVAGEYVFAVSNEVMGVTCVDEVTVTRLAAAASAAPTITAATGSTTGLCAVVEATVSAGARVRWTKKSGPGAVWFGHANSAKTVARFGAAGTYELVCTAETDGGSASAVVSATVSGDDILVTLDGGLGVYWPFKVEQHGSQVDVKRGVTLEGVNGFSRGKGNHLVPGVAGGYGMDLGEVSGESLRQVGTPKYFTFDEYLPSGSSDNNGTPKEPFNTISCWLYHDGNFPYTVWMGTVWGANYTAALHYLPDNGTANDFSMVQNKSSDTPLRFKGPAGLNYTNRWIHLVAQMDNHKTGGSEVWVNGVKLVETSGATLGLGRSTNGDQNALRFGGGSTYGYPPNDPNASIADVSCKMFPGAMDEIRMYRRKLSEAEIRYLYEHPVPSAENEAPETVVPISGVKLYRRTGNKTLAATAFDDGLPAGSALSFAWSVAEGDPSGLSLAPGAGASLVATGLKVGDYKLQLVATDGERTTYSGLVPVSVIAPGMIIDIK